MTDGFYFPKLLSCSIAVQIFFNDQTYFQKQFTVTLVVLYYILPPFHWLGVKVRFQLFDKSQARNRSNKAPDVVRMGSDMALEIRAGVGAHSLPGKLVDGICNVTKFSVVDKGVNSMTNFHFYIHMTVHHLVENEKLQK